MSADQTAPAPPLMKKERAQCECACNPCARLWHGYHIQADIARAVSEIANPPGIRDCPTAFAPRIRPQASDDVGVVSRLRAEIGKDEGLDRVETPRASRARES